MTLRPLYIALLLCLSTVVFSQPAAPDTPGMTIHIVQRGENLFRIALDYGLTVNQVAQVNGIGNVNSIYVGQRLLIPLSPAAEIAPPTQHTVQPGEALQTIAQAYQVDVNTLITLNGITNPDSLYVGQVLTIIPEAEAAPPTVPPAVIVPPAPEVATLAPDPAAPVLTTSGQTHTVLGGQTLFTIATTYGVTMQALQDANNIPNASVIYAGQVLIIPGTQPAQNTVLLPPILSALDVTPLTLAQGKTGRIRLTTSAPATVTAAFLDQAPPVIPLGDGVSYVVWVAIALDATPGIYPFTLTMTETSGAVTAYSFNLQIEDGRYGRVNVALPADKVELLAKPVQDNELSILRSVTGQFNPQRYFDGPLSLPAAAAMNAPFGTLRSYNGGPFENYHYGADFAGAAGSPVLAAAAGRVVLADTLNIRGTAIILDHGWGVYTAYAHLSQRNVNFGDVVASGQVIGAIGSSGRATGAHLHWELWVNGLPVDPLQWVYQAFP
ncbi:MAG: LysM peptidoglycan-binding domain-containing protein [Armatimonadetes bacterium]|nr:LysM peptidoglycan-binding domain-containing protein [Anaerolineae bacterium]